MSHLELVIGNKNYSSWSLRPWIFLQQSGIRFSEKIIFLSTDTTNEELSGYNSGFKVPILIDNDLQVWDSLSIMEYVSEKYLQSGGWPVDPKARAIARSMSAEMHSSFNSVRNEIPMNCRKSFDNFEISNEAESEVKRITDLWEMARTQFGGDQQWLFGKYSIADAMFAPIVLRFHGYNIALPDIAKEYVQSVLSQPGIIQWIEAGCQETAIIDDDEV